MLFQRPYNDNICGKDGFLATTKKRATYVSKEFPLVMPVEYVVDKDKKSVVYVPIQQMLQKLLSRTDVLDKAMSEEGHVPNEYKKMAYTSEKMAFLPVMSSQLPLGCMWMTLR